MTLRVELGEGLLGIEVPGKWVKEMGVLGWMKFIQPLAAENSKVEVFFCFFFVEVLVSEVYFNNVFANLQKSQQILES